MKRQKHVGVHLNSVSDPEILAYLEKGSPQRARLEREVLNQRDGTEASDSSLMRALARIGIEALESNGAGAYGALPPRTGGGRRTTRVGASEQPELPAPPEAAEHAPESHPVLARLAAVEARLAALEERAHRGNI